MEIFLCFSYFLPVFPADSDSKLVIVNCAFIFVKGIMIIQLYEYQIVARGGDRMRGEVLLNDDDVEDEIIGNQDEIIK